MKKSYSQFHIECGFLGTDCNHELVEIVIYVAQLANLSQLPS